VAENFQIWGITFMGSIPFAVYGALNFQRLKMNDRLNDAVIQLHNIARLVEQDIGTGKLSEDIRKAADRLHTLIKIPAEETK
jgi:hypothetical protein